MKKLLIVLTLIVSAPVFAYDPSETIIDDSTTIVPDSRTVICVGC